MSYVVRIIKVNVYTIAMEANPSQYFKKKIELNHVPSESLVCQKMLDFQLLWSHVLSSKLR
jgi:hypothetical protein